MTKGNEAFGALAGLVFLAAGGTGPEASHRVAPTPNGVPQMTRTILPPAHSRSLKGLFALYSPGCTQTPSRRMALLGTYYGNVETAAKANLDSLQRSLTLSGMRVIRFDNLDPGRIASNLEKDRAEHPCDYSARTPLIVLDGDADFRPGTDGRSHHWMRTERITSEFPALAADDEVQPKAPVVGAAYRLVRRTSTAKIIVSLIQGIGVGRRANLVLACAHSGRARDELDPSVRGALASVTVSGTGKNAALLGRLKEGAANPGEFDRNGDGTVSNLELFPKEIVDKTTARKAIDPFSRPLPKPVANVETEGNGYLVGLSPAPQTFDFR